jgi:uncharacterized protein (DUF302 family)
MKVQPGAEFVEAKSAFSFGPTLHRLSKAIEAAGMTIFASIDHEAAARSVGLSMPPTTVLIYGHPKGGTPIMLAAPRSALDLPLRVLVREGEDGRTWVSFHPALPMLRRADVPEALVARLDPAQQILIDAIKP